MNLIEAIQLMTAVPAAYLLFKVIQSIYSSEKPVFYDRDDTSNIFDDNKRGLPACNVGGASMMGSCDINGNAYGVTDSSDYQHEDSMYFDVNSITDD
jgi:hypothetical protein